jgi:hypothetical protein
VNPDDLFARLGRLLDEIEALIETLLDVVPERARRSARVDVARSRRKRLAVAAPEETAELQRLTDELLESQNGNGHG